MREKKRPFFMAMHKHAPPLQIKVFEGGMGVRGKGGKLSTEKLSLSIDTSEKIHKF